MIKIRVYNTPSIAKWIFPNRIWHGNKANNEVYVTFDDGPHVELTPWLLDFARKKEIKLNFFWLGKNAIKLKELKDRAQHEGHFIANHGYEHLNDTKVPNAAYLENFSKGNTIFKEKAFRPPYGRLGQKSAKKIKQTHQIIMWSWLSYDWDKNISNQTIEKKLKKHLKPGHILVFHESDKTKDRFYELIPKIFNIIEIKGLKTASLSKIINA